MVVRADDGAPLARARHVRLEVAARDEDVALLRALEEFEWAPGVVRARRVGAENLLAPLVRALHGAEVTPLLVFQEIVLCLECLVAVSQVSAVVLRNRVPLMVVAAAAAAERNEKKKILVPIRCSTARYQSGRKKTI